MTANRIIAPFFALFVFFTTSAIAQKCHLDKDEKDAFTGEHTRMYKLQFLNTTYWSVQLDQKGSVNSLTVVPTASGRLLLSAPQGTKVLVKLEDNTIWELHTDSDTQPRFSDVATDWNLKSSITDDQLKKLAESPITDIRITIGTQDFSCSSIKGKYGEKIMNAAKCMLQKD